MSTTNLQPRNIVAGQQLGIIDWEQLRPGRRIEDVAQLCWSFASGHRWIGANRDELLDQIA